MTSVGDSARPAARSWRSALISGIPSSSAAAAPARVVERQRVLARQGSRSSQPDRRHDQRWPQDGVQVVQLIGDVGGRPVQCTTENVAHFVRGKVEHVCVERTRNMRRPQRAHLPQFTLTLAVKPLDPHRGVDEQASHQRESRSWRTRSAASKVPAWSNRCPDRLIAAATRWESGRASSRRAAAARSALRLIERRSASASISARRSAGKDTMTFDISKYGP